MAAHSGDNIKLCTNPNLTNVVDGHWFLGACRIGKKRQEFLPAEPFVLNGKQMIKSPKAHIICSVK